jgi:hypothetical protein
VRFGRNELRVDCRYDHWERQCERPGAASISVCPGVETVMQLLLAQLRRPGPGKG